MNVERALQWSSVATIIGLVLVVPSALAEGAGVTPWLAIVVLAIAAVLTSWASFKVYADRHARERR